MFIKTSTEAMQSIFKRTFSAILLVGLTWALLFWAAGWLFITVAVGVFSIGWWELDKMRHPENYPQPLSPFYWLLPVFLIGAIFFNLLNLGSYSVLVIWLVSFLLSLAFINYLEAVRQKTKIQFYVFVGLCFLLSYALLFAGWYFSSLSLSLRETSKTLMLGFTLSTIGLLVGVFSSFFAYLLVHKSGLKSAFRVFYSVEFWVFFSLVVTLSYFYAPPRFSLFIFFMIFAGLYSTALQTFITILGGLLTIALLALIMVFWMPLQNKRQLFWIWLFQSWVALPVLLWIFWFVVMPNGNYWLLWLVAVVAVGDSAALIGGKLLGKHKLAPKISPGKTWEGALCSLIAAVAVGFWLATVYPQTAVKLGPDYYTIGWLLLCLCTNVLAQFGDLFESKIKRHFGVKDSGSLIPGHGGLLDRLDGYFFPTLLLSIWFIWLL